jgi:hypothetical protein
MNGFEDYRESLSNLLNHEQLLARVKYLNELVYPAVTLKAKRKQAQDAAAFNKRYKDKLYDDSHFVIGSWVMAKDQFRTDKLSPRYEGPFEIIRRNRGGSYLLRGQDDTIYKRPACSLKLVSQIPVITLPSDHVEVESILDHRPKTLVSQDDSEYLVKWKNRDMSLCQWVPSKDFDGTSLIIQYFKNLKKSKQALARSYPSPYRVRRFLVGKNPTLPPKVSFEDSLLILFYE